MIHAFGDEAFEIEVRDTRDARRVARALSRVHGVVECVVGWDRVLAMVSATHRPTREALLAALLGAGADPVDEETSVAPRTHVVRCVYDGEDLREVAEACGLTPGQVAERHATTYEVEVVGFLPGFAYLGGVDPSIARPRRVTARPRIAKNSVGIAGARTAIYPLPSPGGWNLIGRAIDVVPFDPDRTPPALFGVGDRVRFEIADVVEPRR